MKTFFPLYLIAVVPFLLKTFAAIRKSDPNYSEEFHQVYDAKLNATIIIYCDVGFNQQSEEQVILTIRPILSSFQKLKFFHTDILICDDLRRKLGSKIDFQVNTLVGKKAQISALTSDVLIVFGSPDKESVEFLSDSQRKSSEGFKGKLSINCFLNMSPHRFNHSIPALLYDVVLLSTQSEAHRYTHSWLATMDLKQQMQTQSTAIIPRVFSLPIYKGTAYSTRNNSVSLFMYDQKKVVETIERIIIDGIIGSTFKRFVARNETMLTMRKLSLLPLTAASSPKQRQDIGIYV
jgi:hypothetical protein